MEKKFKILGISNCFEKEIFIDGLDILLKYYLSNNFDVIKDTVYTKIGNNINIDNSSWKINPELSIDVKNAMNQLDVNYSMALYTLDGFKHLAVNRRFQNKWFYLGFTEVNGFYYNDEQIQCSNKKFLDMEELKIQKLEREIQRESEKMELELEYLFSQMENKKKRR